MIEEFVKAWDKNNHKLLEHFKKEAPAGYEGIVKKLVDIVINPYLRETSEYPIQCGLNINRMTVIDDGDYQGSLLYIIPFDVYQPSPDEYVATSVYYGSCSVCDTFQGIESEMEFDDKTYRYIITDNIAQEFHTLALHLLQGFRFLYTR